MHFNFLIVILRMSEMGNNLSRESMMDPSRQSNIIMQSPTMQQRMKAIGVPTPLTMSSPLRRYVLYTLNFKNLYKDTKCVNKF